MSRSDGRRDYAVARLIMQNCLMSWHRFLQWLAITLARHKREILLGYAIVATCVLSYAVNFALKVASFAVQIPPTDLQYVLTPMCKDCDRMLHFMNIVHRQSIANSIFADFAHLVPEFLFGASFVSLILIARNGRFPFFIRLTSRGIHWCYLMGLCFIVFMSIGIVVHETMLVFVASNDIVTSERSMHEMFNMNPANAIAIMYARRSLLVGSAITHSIALIVIVSLFLSIPLIRIIWAERYVE